MKIFIVAVHLVLGIIFIIGGLALMFGSYPAYVGYGVVGVALGLLSGAAGFDLVRNKKWAAKILIPLTAVFWGLTFYFGLGGIFPWNLLPYAVMPVLLIIEVIYLKKRREQFS